jgi:hypothetical protein
MEPLRGIKILIKLKKTKDFEILKSFVFMLFWAGILE